MSKSSAKDLARHLLAQDLSEEAVMFYSVRTSKLALADHRAQQGFKQVATPLLAKPADNMKTAKGAGTWTLTLAPADASGDWNVCRYSTDNCRDACVLTTSGNARYDSVQRARKAKTMFLAEDPQRFLRLLVDELDKLPAGSLVRLNTGSDIPWEQVCFWLFERFAHLKFYDYTKWTDRPLMPANYRTTFSISERQTMEEAMRLADSGRSVAVVVNVKRGQAFPSKSVIGPYGLLPLVDGDEDDDRFKDPAGSVVFLRAKGDARSQPVGDDCFVKAVNV